MRTLVDIPDPQIAALAAIGSANKISRAEVIRRAITAYVEQHRVGSDDAFGLWKETLEDGVAYQERVRSEW